MGIAKGAYRGGTTKAHKENRFYYCTVHTNRKSLLWKSQQLNTHWGPIQSGAPRTRLLDTLGTVAAENCALPCICSGWTSPWTKFGLHSNHRELCSTFVRDHTVTTPLHHWGEQQEPQLGLLCYFRTHGDEDPHLHFVSREAILSS